MAGLAAARARGRNGGRPSTMTPRKIAVARQMKDAKGPDGRSLHTPAEIAAVIGASRSTIYKHLNS